MSRIDDLIAELCPDGVEFKTLGEIGDVHPRSAGSRRLTSPTTGVGAIHYVTRSTHIYGTGLTATEIVRAPEAERELRASRTGDLIITTTSEDDEEVGEGIARSARRGSRQQRLPTASGIGLDPQYIVVLRSSREHVSAPEEAAHHGHEGPLDVSGEALSKSDPCAASRGAAGDRRGALDCASS